jgi:hypothetical protein
MSSRIGILKVNSFNDEDILNLPYPEGIHSLKLTEADAIVINDAIEYYSNPRKSSVHKKLYQEEMPIEDIPLFTDLFCKGFNTYASTKDKEFSLTKIIDAGDYFAVQLELREIGYRGYTIDNNKEIASYLKSVFPAQAKKLPIAHIQKIMKVYGKGVIVLVKPKQRRFWLQSIALRDSDDIFADNIKMLQAHV